MWGHDTISPAKRVANFCVGAVEVALSSSSSSSLLRVLYAVPHGVPSIEAVAFPGDGVPYPSWPSLLGAIGHHPHSGGLLGTLHDRFQQEGGKFGSAALLVVEPSLGDTTPFAIYDLLLPFPLTASGEPTSRYDGSGLQTSTRLDAIFAAVYRHAACEQKAPESQRATAAASAAARSVPLLAFGFSKGGIVLNQLLAELAELSCAPPLRSLPSSSSPSSSAPSSSSPSSSAPSSAQSASKQHDAAELATSLPATSLPATSLLNRLAEVHYLDAGMNVRAHKQALRGTLSAQHMNAWHALHACHKLMRSHGERTCPRPPPHTIPTYTSSSLVRVPLLSLPLLCSFQGRGSHLTDPAIINALGRRSQPPAVFMHGTPRQWSDPRRSYVREEMERSAALLAAAAVPVRSKLYFEDEGRVDHSDERAGLAMHFGCVERFSLRMASEDA